jgi:hypothetical protein
MVRPARLAWIALAASACAVEARTAALAADTPPALTALRWIPTPAGPGSVTPCLARSRDGEVWMSWLEPRARGGHVLEIARLDGHGWTNLREAASGDSFYVNWADRPGIAALGEGCLAAHWRVKSGADGHACDIRLAFSGDRGRTWSNPVCPHRDATASEHGFVTLLPEADGVRAIWLDGRNSAAARAQRGASLAEAHGDHEVDADITLRTALIHMNGRLEDEALLDGRACDCCPTAAVRTLSGTLVAYRDRSADEVRDIALVRRGESAADERREDWSEAYPLHADGWKIPGCPVNGPALDADDDLVAAAWYSEARDSARVWLAFSRDGGRHFGAPIPVDDGAPLGRVDVALLEDRSALVLWLEAGANDADILARRVAADGTRSAPITIAATSARRASGYPRMIRDGRRVIFVWTELGNPSRVRVAEAMGSER